MNATTRLNPASKAGAPNVPAPSADRILWLDSLRGIAALTIACFWHYQHLSGDMQGHGVAPLQSCPWWNFPPAWLVFQFSQLAVDFFFVLSGIIFTHVYWKRVRNREVSATVFFRRRFARLYPIHFATLIACAWLAWSFKAWAGRWPIDPGGDINGPYGFLENLLFLQGGLFPPSGYNGASWSLTIEEMMYVTFFLMARYEAGNWMPIGMVVLGFTVFVHHGDDVILINRQVARGLMGFGSGILLYRYFPRCLPRPRWLEVRPLVWLGDLSLTIYMIHLPIQMLIIVAFWRLGTTLPFDTWALWIMYVVAVIGLSDIVRNYYVEPMRRLLRP